MLILYLLELVSHEIKGFIPGRPLERAAFFPADKRPLQPVLTVDEFKTEPAFDTQPATVVIVGLRIDTKNLVSGAPQGKIASATTVGTGGFSFLHIADTGLS